MCFPSKRRKDGSPEEGGRIKRSRSAQEPAESTNTPAPPTSTGTKPTTTQTTDTTMSSPRLAIVIYTMYGHVAKLAEAIKSGIEGAGGNASIFQVAETLSPEILNLVKAPPKPDYPVMDPLDLKNYDGFLFGIPTRYGNFPVQWKAFWDSTGPLWASTALCGKYAGLFVSTGSPGGGQESTLMAAMSTLVHHGVIYVPLGYKYTFAQLANLTEVRGGSPWGAGTFANSDGSRQPTPLELEIANLQGKSFYEYVARVKW
ncbi:NADH quinone oxidoreductase [Gloeophyllum trabeum ATCC 11539]|uniref:NADH quinone oxidoreductase n=2 Tax=Gloeophyllum trabeum TaxID=104355 RepID=S7RDC3_GLOTA|nr:NADH quinone oxidoreductase [Gloeophyllum trabeum ATCC 11539]AAL67859.1 NADH:quinone oxidoreductase [Gloeophyllum trabeum]AAL67860.2 NADH:quinone oxidoreductase [Gloeophyllum trabeum]EPQ50429.1 NADH quinone oxidoreductase [Gloeophyllum trabeum ATCC 11539]